MCAIEHTYISKHNELVLVCWSLTCLCHCNGHIWTMPAREINPFTALTGIWSQFLRTQWRAIMSEWTRLHLRPLSHRGWHTMNWSAVEYTIWTCYPNISLYWNWNLWCWPLCTNRLNKVLEKWTYDSFHPCTRTLQSIKHYHTYHVAQYGMGITLPKIWIWVMKPASINCINCSR